LVVLDDGEDNIADVVPDHPEIRYCVSTRRHSLGSKRNLACAASTGTIIAHWDDDDWYAPWRLSRQVAEIVAGEADLCGLTRMLFFDPAAQRAWEYVYPAGAAPWVYGATFCYRKSIWEQSPFLDNTGCEDNLFIANLATGVRLRTLLQTGMFVGLVHSANSSPKHTNDLLWRPQPLKRIRRVVGNNWVHAPRRATSGDAYSLPVSALSASWARSGGRRAVSVAVAPVYANPKGGQVAVGTAVITQTSPRAGSTSSSRPIAAIDWRALASRPRANFQQPAPSSMTLNACADPR
jgi:hypothetical protein